MTNIIDATDAKAEASPIDTVLAPINTLVWDLEAFMTWFRGNPHAAGLADFYTLSIARDYDSVGGYKIRIMCQSPEQLAAATRLIMHSAPIGAISKSVDDDYQRIARSFGDLTVEAWAVRSDVCTRKVVGTEKVMVPDPNAPLVEVEQDIVEWDCEPVLSHTPTCSLCGGPHVPVNCADPF